MRVAEIGDNCIDVYERIGKKYPTGNVVDTGVNLQKLGIPVSIISTTGNDENGKWMLETLKKEGVDISHLKIGDGATAVTYMDMDGKDRVHGDYVEGVLENIVFDEEDIEFAAEHFLDLAGIKSPGLSAAPAIALEAVKMLADQGLALNKKENIVDSRKHLRFKKLSNEEKNRIIAQDPAYGRVICRCETVTEGEIINAIRRPVGARSLDGVKRRTRAGMGRCQAGFCSPRVMEILERELSMNPLSVTKHGQGSELLTGTTREESGL